MSFRQDRTNPSTAISNWKGRSETPKGWPSTRVSTWMNGALFGGAPKHYWILALHVDSATTQTTGGGVDVDSDDNIYWGVTDQSGNNSTHYLIKLDTSTALPTVTASKKTDTAGSGLGTVQLYDNKVLWIGPKNAESATACITGYDKTLTTLEHGGATRRVVITSGEDESGYPDGSHIDSSGNWWWQSMDKYSYFGWHTFQAGMFKSPWQTVNATNCPIAIKSNDQGTNRGTQISPWTANSYIAAGTVYSSTALLWGATGTSGHTGQGSNFRWSQTSSEYFSVVKTSVLTTNEGGTDYAYWWILNAHPSNQSCYLVKLDTSGTVQWVRKLVFTSQYGAASQGLTGYVWGVAPKPAVDPDGNIYVTCGFRMNQSWGQPVVGIAKYNSSGTIQWCNTIAKEDDGSHTNWFNPQRIRISEGGKAFIISINRYGNPAPSTAGAMLARLPTDGTLTSATAHSLDSGTVTYNTASYTDAAASGFSIDTSYTGVSLTQDSAATDGSGWPVASAFTSYTDEVTIDGS